MEQFEKFKHLPHCVALARYFLGMVRWDTFVVYSVRKDSFVVEQRTDIGNTYIHVFENDVWIEMHTPELWSTLYYKNVEDAVRMMKRLQIDAVCPPGFPPKKNRDVEL